MQKRFFMNCYLVSIIKNAADFGSWKETRSVFPSWLKLALGVDGYPIVTEVIPSSMQISCSVSSPRFQTARAIFFPSFKPDAIFSHDGKTLHVSFHEPKSAAFFMIETK